MIELSRIIGTQGIAAVDFGVASGTSSSSPQFSHVAPLLLLASIGFSQSIPEQMGQVLAKRFSMGQRYVCPVDESLGSNAGYDLFATSDEEIYSEMERILTNLLSSQIDISPEEKRILGARALDWYVW